MNFIVVNLNQYYDHVESIDHIKSFSTEEDAISFIKELEEEMNLSIRLRNRYIDEFVESIECPETDYKGWINFIKKFDPYAGVSTNPDDFKNNLKNYLRHYNLDIEGYKPPPKNSKWEYLHVVEIKD